MIPIVTITQFRADFPEFANTTAYSDTRVQFYLNLAMARLDPLRWVDLWAYGVELYTAHNLVLATQRGTSATAGVAPGLTTGLVTSKAVGPVSKSMDYGTVTTVGAGVYNLTAYGSEYYQLMMSIGIGGMQL